MTLPNMPGNARFFANAGPQTLARVIAAAGCEPSSHELLLTGLAALDAAGPAEVSFASGRRHLAALSSTRAGAVIVQRDLQASVPGGAIALVTEDPAAAWAKVAALFHPVHAVKPGIHASAAVAEDASIDPSAEIGPHVTIGSRAEIGPGCRIGPSAVIGDGVVLGPACVIGANVSISHAILGARVYIYPGARIGQEGFGFTIGPRGFQTVPQLGCVILEDDVEVGANSTIDRGTLRDTVIGAGSRLDNLVQVGHNVRIGRHCAIAAQVGISGSVEIGDFVVVGGQAGFAEHIRVGSRVQIGAQSGVMNNIEDGQVIVGSPARPVREVFREIATLKKIARPRQS